MKQVHTLILGTLLALCAAELVAAPLRAPKSEEPTRRLAPPPPPTTAEEVLRRALEARGGKAAAERIHSFRWKGTIDYATDLHGAFEYLAARPNQARVIYNFGRGSRYDNDFDGQTAWVTKPGSGPRRASEELAREARDAAAFFAAYDDPHAYRSVALAGETSFDNTRCYELKLITGSGLEQTHYYNVTNYLLAGTVRRATADTGQVWVQTRFREYGQFGGFCSPRACAAAPTRPNG